MDKPIIVIVGPTASGKTDLSIEVAKKFNGECINADSTQIFEGTDIATNKITEKEMEGIPHHLLSIRKVNENFSALDFQKQCRKKIDEIWNRGKTPIIIGGTGYYITAAIKEYKFIGAEADMKNRTRFVNLTNEQLWGKLKAVAPDVADKLHPNNRNKVMRMLELSEATNNLRKELERGKDKYFYNNLIIVGINFDRDQLYKRINARVHRLIDIGLFNEIEQAWIANDKNDSAQALKCIGGPEIIAYLKGFITYEDSILKMQQNNRNYAKKQFTYFRNQLKNTEWFDYNEDNIKEMNEEVIKFIQKEINKN